MWRQPAWARPPTPHQSCCAAATCRRRSTPLHLACWVSGWEPEEGGRGGPRACVANYLPHLLQSCSTAALRQPARNAAPLLPPPCCSVGAGGRGGGVAGHAPHAGYPASHAARSPSASAAHLPPSAGGPHCAVLGGGAGGQVGGKMPAGSARRAAAHAAAELLPAAIPDVRLVHQAHDASNPPALLCLMRPTAGPSSLSW